MNCSTESYILLWSNEVHRLPSAIYQWYTQYRLPYPLVYTTHIPSNQTHDGGFIKDRMIDNRLNLFGSSLINIVNHHFCNLANFSIEDDHVFPLFNTITLLDQLSSMWCHQLESFIQTI